MDHALADKDILCSFPVITTCHQTLGFCKRKNLPDQSCFTTDVNASNTNNYLPVISVIKHTEKAGTQPLPNLNAAGLQRYRGNKEQDTRWGNYAVVHEDDRSQTPPSTHPPSSCSIGHPRHP